MDYRDARKLVESLGMSISGDGVAFTVCGSELINGEPAPPAIVEMNGWTVDDVAREVTERRQSDATWPFAAPAGPSLGA